MTTINERIIKLQDKQIKDLERARELDRQLYTAELRQLCELAESYRQDVQHWQNQVDREHNAFVQAAADRDQAIKDKADLRRRNKHLREVNEGLLHDRLDAITEQKRMAAFIDNIAEMIACDCELSDIADEFIAWRKGEWAPTDSIEDMVGSIIDEDPGSFFGGVEDKVESLQAEDQRRSDPNDVYRWKVLVVEHQGDEAIFTGIYANYDLARESVDLMVARGCYEAWVEELQ